MTQGGPELIVQAFRSAREDNRPLDAYPGEMPANAAEAYALQDMAIAGRPVPGWKIAGVRPDMREAFGANRIAGPILKLIDLRQAGNGALTIPVIAGGFAAVEAEFAFVLKQDLPDNPTEAQIVEAVGAMHVAIEIAGGPFAGLSDLGPAAVVSDHGNNLAVVLGPEVGIWVDKPLDALTAAVSINGKAVAQGSAANLPEGGPLGAVSWLVGNLVDRGHRLKQGHVISTGATTGVHRVNVGDRIEMRFVDLPPLTLRITAADARK